MLCRLTVENYALIDRLDTEFAAGLNIITGETGAGKSILLGALGLVLWGAVAHAWLGYAPNYLQLAQYGALANVVGQLGDLSMSLIKREAGVKDFSHLFLTHGGMLDRFDSTLFIAPWLYLFVCAGGL